MTIHSGYPSIALESRKHCTHGWIDKKKKKLTVLYHREDKGWILENKAFRTCKKKKNGFNDYVNVCVCASPASRVKLKNSSIPEGSALIQIDMWAITICVWACEEISGRWLLMNKQWQHECSDLRRCSKLHSFFDWIVFATVESHAKDHCFKILVIDQSVKTERIQLWDGQMKIKLNNNMWS